MKAIVQRVTCASVTVEGRLVSSIGRGMCVLLGISRDDSSKEAEWMAKKLLNLRIFNDPTTNKPWDRNVVEVGQEILCVSQFTLCHVLKGNKPDFHNALGSDASKPMYEDFLARLQSLYKPEAVKGGEFGAFMQVHIQNDGPITLQLDSPQLTAIARVSENKRKAKLNAKGGNSKPVGDGPEATGPGVAVVMEAATDKHTELEELKDE